jgi:hypothetical protein
VGDCFRLRKFDEEITFWVYKSLLEEGSSWIYNSISVQNNGKD